MVGSPGRKLRSTPPTTSTIGDGIVRRVASAESTTTTASRLTTRTIIAVIAVGEAFCMAHHKARWRAVIRADQTSRLTTITRWLLSSYSSISATEQCLRGRGEERIMVQHH